MRRRDFLSVIGGATAWPFAARAQQSGIAVVGFFNPAPAAEAIPHLVAAFRQGLAEAGYVEGKKRRHRIPLYRLQTRHNV
jgi:putative tryptophan/tyrosine transport system substrate-binding protein